MKHNNIYLSKEETMLLIGLLGEQKANDNKVVVDLYLKLKAMHNG